MIDDVKFISFSNDIILIVEGIVMIEISLVINLIIVICEFITLLHIKGKVNILKYYTYLQNLIALLVSLIYSTCVIICLVTGSVIPDAIKGLRYIATTGLISTMFIFIVFLGAGKKVSITQDDFIRGFNYKLANAILHYICPILSLISFVVFEREIILENGIWTMLVAIPSCLYWLVYVVLSATKAWKEPYNFTSKNKILEVLTYIFIPVSFIVLSFIIWNLK